MSPRRRPALPEPVVIDARAYAWTELEGLRAILRFTGGAALDETAEVRLEHVRDAENEYGSLMWSRWGTQVDDIQEAFRFGDRVLVCATTRTWQGTFQPHDKIAVQYYGLTPREAAGEDA